MESIFPQEVLNKIQRYQNFYKINQLLDNANKAYESMKLLEPEYIEIDKKMKQAENLYKVNIHDYERQISEQLEFKILKLLNSRTHLHKSIRESNYFIYSYNGKPLIAVPEYYHGKGKWKPHMSIVKLDKINRSNPSLYLLYQKYGINALIKPLLKAKGQIETLNMSYHFRSLRISIIRG